MTIVINNLDWLITVDKSRRIIKNGSIVVSDGLIQFVGKTGERARVDGENVIDGKGLIAVPGLIDTSVSVVQQLGRGLGDLCDIPEYRLNRVASYEAALHPDDARAAARHFALEMIRAGSTFFVDTGSRYPLEIAQTVVEQGLKGIVGFACQDVFDTPMGPYATNAARLDLEQVLERAERAIIQIREIGRDLVAPCICIPWLTGCSDALGAALSDLANKHDLPVVVSASASRDEAVHSRIHSRMTEIKRLEKLGLLGARTIISHAGWTNPDDLRLIVQSGATVACCPSMSHRLGTGALEQGRYPELIAFGANVTLGSGSAMASNYVDVARQLYLFSGGSKTYRLDATIAGPENSVEMATVRAAAALGRSKEIGSLEESKQADVAMFRCATADWTPVINPIQNLVFSSRGGADTVLVAGKILLLHGAPVRADEAAIMRDSQWRAEAIARRSNLERFSRSAWQTSGLNPTMEK
ncbi:MAG: amidohydrolase [Bradyrhizobium sp.]|jgi:5-methylthioadenosine/S-adenosylhomocysteine deaminase|nr:amidohydrolase [Bradyrhizobium sp.]